MTEVRPAFTSGNGSSSSSSSSSERGCRNEQLGLFACKEYKMGECILSKISPLIRLSPSSDEEERALIERLQQRVAPSSSSSHHTPATTTTTTTTTTKTTAKNKDDEDRDNTTNNHPPKLQQQQRLWDAIVVPDDDAIVVVSAKMIGKFKGMVQACLMFLHSMTSDTTTTTVVEDTKKQLLQLYYPQQQQQTENGNNNNNGNDNHQGLSSNNNPYEAEIVGIAKLAARYVVDHTITTNNNNDSSSTTITKTTTAAKETAAKEEEDDDDLIALLERVALIWSCNSFEGGRIYPETISRINHSCNPNAMIQINHDNTNNNDDDNNNNNNKEQQSVVAIAPIPTGDEITISYLDLFIYAERSIRQSILQSTKHFTCTCTRCRREEENSSSMDTASLVPCPTCHPRTNHRSQQLDEDTQYDDEQAVSYVSAQCLIASSSSREEEGNNHAPVVQQQVYCDKCRPTKPTSTGVVSTPPTATKDYYGHLVSAMKRVQDKVVQFLQDRQQQQHTTTKSKRNGGGCTEQEEDEKDNDDYEDDDEKEEADLLLLDQHLRLSSNVMGAKHWTTNLLLLLHLDHTLKSIHRDCLFNDTKPDMAVLAEAIDMLQRLVRFVDGFSTATAKNTTTTTTTTAVGQHYYYFASRGHLLSHVIIGTARALVGLGDLKSQKYAAEWVEPIRQHVQLFESSSSKKNTGIQKVVETIANAYKEQHNNNNHNNNNNNNNTAGGGSKNKKTHDDASSPTAKKRAKRKN